MDSIRSSTGLRSASGSVPPGSATPAPSTIAAPFKIAEGVDKELALVLKVPEHLIRTTGNGNTNIFLGYQKYEGYLAATNKYATMVSNGTWRGPAPKPDAIKNIFFSKSMYHSHYKYFAELSNYPDTLLWVQNKPGKPSNIKAWGEDIGTYSMNYMKEWVINGGSFPKKKSKGKTVVTRSKDKKKKTK